MKHQTLGQIAAYAGARLVPPRAASKLVRAVSIDTRTIDAGDVYVPIIGEHLDGHRFIEQAFEKGALAAFHDTKHLPEPDDQRPYLEVEDTTKAFSKLAANYREELTATVIGITGSNGKTTTKDVLHSVLSEHFRTRKTTGNLNNEIGVPRTLLQMHEDTEMAVVEMGMSGFGEMSHLTHMVKPDIAVITNVGDVHLEQLGTQENVAKAKLEILESMDASKLFLYNYDNAVLRKAVQEREILPEVISYGTEEGADVKLKLLRATPGGTTFTLDGTEFTVDLLGSFQMYNAAVAIILARRLGMEDDEIRRGLHVQEQTRWRAELAHFAGFDMLIDVYKSNPPSLREALAMAEMLEGYQRKIAIIGDMLELGPQEAELHRAIGRELKPEVFDAVLFYGPLSKAMMEGAAEHFPESRLYHFDNKPGLVSKAKDLVAANTLVLLKGSRAMRLEEVVESLSIITTN